MIATLQHPTIVGWIWHINPQLPAGRTEGEFHIEGLSLNFATSFGDIRTVCVENHRRRYFVNAVTRTSWVTKVSQKGLGWESTEYEGKPFRMSHSDHQKMLKLLKKAQWHRLAWHAFPLWAADYWQKVLALVREYGEQA